MKNENRKQSKKDLFIGLIYAHIEALFSGNALDF